MDLASGFHRREGKYAIVAPMFRVQYLCPTQSMFWQDLTSGLIFKSPQQFGTIHQAIAQANSLIWQYHAARVLDQWGRVVYEV